MENDKFCDFPIQQEVHNELETTKGTLQDLKTEVTTSFDECPSLKCQRLKLRSFFVEGKKEAGPGLID